MDYNKYNYDYNNDFKKKKRKAQSVQEMMSVSPRPSVHHTSSRTRSRTRTDHYEAPSFSGGVGQSAGVIFYIILKLYLLITLLNYNAITKKKTYRYPLNVVSVNGVLNDIYENNYASAQTDATGAVESATQAAPTPVPMNDLITASDGVSGVAMLLDAGGGVDGYTEAANYSELLTQLGEAMSKGDDTFVGSKIGYIDETTGSHLGYPQSVVEHFTSYMAANSDKRQAFLDTIGSAEQYSATNGSAIIVALPKITYKVTTDYDGTSFTFSGFSEQTINANQVAAVEPMLPCMYSVHATCPSWAKPVEGTLEATFGENLEVNFGTN